MITILEKCQGEIVEKKSKFICNIYHVESKEEAENKIKELKKIYYDARHNCNAYRVYEDEKIIEKSSDDGEPSGTAGGPMLNILKKSDIINCLVVVTRYFGGILLGTGGLVRAYSNALNEAINNAEKLEICLGMEYEIKIDYESLENFKYYCKINNIKVINIQYFQEIVCNIDIYNKDISKFLKDIEERNLKVLEFKEIKKKFIEKRK